MEQQAAQNNFSRDAILQDIIGILKSMTSDWDMDFTGSFGPDTKLMGDLAFESIDVVQFIVAIEERFKTRKIPFENLLMQDGRYVDEIQVKDAVDFLFRHLNNQS